jgi:Protein of unknown function (DUF2786)
MGKPNRLGRHAKPRQWKRDRRREPDPVIAPDAPGASASALAPADARPHALADARPQASAGASAQNPAGARPQASAGARAQDLPGARAQNLAGAGPQADDPGDGAPSAAARAEQLVSDALQALADGQHDVFVRCAAQLAERPGQPGWQRAVEQELLLSLLRAVTGGWRQGWQPAEVVREISRQFGARHARMATDATAMDMRNYARAAVDERWQAQLVTLGATAWWDSDHGYLEQWREREQLGTEAAVTCVLEVLYGLAALPRLGRLCPLPGTARPAARAAERPTVRTAGQRAVGRVRALLAKAESTEFPEEAEALTVRAQELITRHTISEALLAAGTGPADQDAASGRRVFVDNPYELAKTDLLDVVATVNLCRAVPHQNLGLSTVLGDPAGLDAVELLFASLLVQATAAMVRAGQQHHDDAGPPGTRSFRRSFLASYTQRIGERLAGAAEAARRQAVADAPDGGVAPVLAARRRAVDEAVRKMFPELARQERGRAPDRLPVRTPAYVALRRERQVAVA